MITTSFSFAAEEKCVCKEKKASVKSTGHDHDASFFINRSNFHLE